MRECKQVIHGDYVATPIKNAFNHKTAYWLSKKNCILAVYMFTVENCSSDDVETMLSENGIQAFVNLLETKLNHNQEVNSETEEQKTPVLDATTSQNQSLEVGDFVQYMNCGRLMLVDINTDVCPVCEEKTLAWADPNNPEISLSGEELAAAGYELLDRPSYESTR